MKGVVFLFWSQWRSWNKNAAHGQSQVLMAILNCGGRPANRIMYMINASIGGWMKSQKTYETHELNNFSGFDPEKMKWVHGR